MSTDEIKEKIAKKIDENWKVFIEENGESIIEGLKHIETEEDGDSPYMYISVNKKYLDFNILDTCYPTFFEGLSREEDWLIAIPVDCKTTINDLKNVDASELSGFYNDLEFDTTVIEDEKDENDKDPNITQETKKEFWTEKPQNEKSLADKFHDRIVFINAEILPRMTELKRASIATLGYKEYKEPWEIASSEELKKMLAKASEFQKTCLGTEWNTYNKDDDFVVWYSLCEYIKDGLQANIKDTNIKNNTEQPLDIKQLSTDKLESLQKEIKTELQKREKEKDTNELITQNKFLLKSKSIVFYANSSVVSDHKLNGKELDDHLISIFTTTQLSDTQFSHESEIKKRDNYFVPVLLTEATIDETYALLNSDDNPLGYPYLDPKTNTISSERKKQGETNQEYIKKNKLHTSMSVNDLIWFPESNEVFVCQGVGWKKISWKPNRSKYQYLVDFLEYLTAPIGVAEILNKTMKKHFIVNYIHDGVVQMTIVEGDKKNGNRKTGIFISIAKFRELYNREPYKGITFTLTFKNGKQIPDIIAEDKKIRISVSFVYEGLARILTLKDGEEDETDECLTIEEFNKLYNRDPFEGLVLTVTYKNDEKEITDITKEARKVAKEAYEKLTGENQEIFEDDFKKYIGKNIKTLDGTNIDGWFPVVEDKIIINFVTGDFDVLFEYTKNYSPKDLELIDNEYALLER